MASPTDQIGSAPQRWQGYTRAEQNADCAIHILGVSAAMGACIMLTVVGSQTSARSAIALGLYAVGLFAMLACSALYNLVSKTTAKPVLRRLDHAAIFVMIAGTYTPVTILGIGGEWGWGLLISVWVGALAGAFLKLAAPGRFERASIAAYLLLGWAGLAALGPLVAVLPGRDIALLGIGGLLYSSGVLVHLSTGLRYHNALWHALVLAAAACHFVVVFNLGVGSIQ